MSKVGQAIYTIEELYDNSKKKYMHYVNCLKEFGFDKDDFEMAARKYGEMNAYANMGGEIFGDEELAKDFKSIGPIHLEYYPKEDDLK